MDLWPVPGRAEHPRSRPPPPVPGRDPPPAAWGEGGAPALTSGEGFIKAAGGEEIPNAGAEPQRSRQRLPAAASPRPTRRRDAVVPPPVRPGPALHRPGPRHRLGRPLGPAAPAVPAEVPGCCRREAGESPATGWPPRAPLGHPVGHPDAPASEPASLLQTPASPPETHTHPVPRCRPSVSPPEPLAPPLQTPGFTAADPYSSPLDTPVPSVQTSRTSPVTPFQNPSCLLQILVPQQIPWFTARAEPSDSLGS